MTKTDYPVECGKAVYFCGASGVGKTTLAKWVSKKFGFTLLESRARHILAEMGIPNFATVLADEELYATFQKKVCDAQWQSEYKLLPECNYVSDRCFDHLAFASLYGTVAEYVWKQQTFKDYIECLLNRIYSKVAVVFLVHPSREALDAALKQGGRSEFLEWDRMQQFHGAVQTIAQIKGIQMVHLTTPSMRLRQETVHSVLTGMWGL